MLKNQNYIVSEKYKSPRKVGIYFYQVKESSKGLTHVFSDRV